MIVWKTHMHFVLSCTSPTTQVFICLNCEESRSVESVRQWLARPRAQKKTRKAASASKKKAQKRQSAVAIKRSATLESWLTDEGQSLMEASVDEIKKAYEKWLTEGMEKGQKAAKMTKKKTKKPVDKDKSPKMPKTSALHLKLAAPDAYYDIKSYPLFVVFDEVVSG